MAQESSIPHILSMLRIILHLSFAALLGVGILRTFIEQTQLAPLICILLTAAFTACLYFVGTLSEIRFAKGQSSFDPRSLTTWWLASILVLWAGLAMSGESFVWVSFPLFFLVLYAWPPIGAAAAIVGMLVVIAGSSVLHSAFTPGVIIGPLVGAIVAVTISAVYAKLVDEAVRTRAAFDELRAAQAKLALSQQQEGRLAERQKVAAEFHDTIAQSLLSIVLISRAGQNRNDVQELQGDLSTIENTPRTASQQSAVSSRVKNWAGAPPKQNSRKPAPPSRPPLRPSALPCAPSFPPRAQKSVWRRRLSISFRVPGSHFCRMLSCTPKPTTYP